MWELDNPRVVALINNIIKCVESEEEISEDQMYNLELNSFMKLLETQNTQNRIAHTLKTGKPLIN